MITWSRQVNASKYLLLTLVLLLPQAYLDPSTSSPVPESVHTSATHHSSNTGLAKRVIACLDVRGNDQGDLVVTKVRQ